MIAEDCRRRRARALLWSYDPVRGRANAPGRLPSLTVTPENGATGAYLPRQMTLDPEYSSAKNNVVAWQRLRCRYDFEYWCFRCVRIKAKELDSDVPFKLNYAQRQVTDILEAQRLAGKPLRLIILKARQWGASTLIQVYMAWMQCCVHRNWNSLICAHVKDAAAGIRGTYTKLLANYPKELWEGDEVPQFRPYERAQNIREIAGRNCRVTIGSAENQDAIRGSDYAMAHLSETAFWPSSPTRTPEQCVRAVCGAVALLPDTLIAMESTANGVGNYFHKEWLRCKEGKGDKTPVFIPWHNIELNVRAVTDPAEFAATMDDYERHLWNMGLCLDQICWFRHKLREYPTLQDFQSEYPTSDTEAFASTGAGVFAPEHVDALRGGCRAPAAVGEVVANGGGEFVADSRGGFKMWEAPQRGVQYVVAVDVGGRSDKADWSVVLVLRRAGADTPPSVAGQWRGHCDHDILVDKAEAVARLYNNALLVIESNTLECDAYGSGADSNLFVLNRLAQRYHNLYRRETFDSVTREYSDRIGFHTNVYTKSILINGLIQAVRQGTYIERDSGACDELATYERRSNGSYGAKNGCHDDMLMTRAMALYADTSTPQLPPAGCNWNPRRWQPVL